MTAKKKTARSKTGRRRNTARPLARSRRRPVDTAAVRRLAREGSGLAPGMQVVNTYLAVANVAASMEFLERAFGFSRGVVLPGAEGQPRYAEMRHGDSVVMLVPRGDATSATNGAAALYTYVEDVDRALADARQAGAGVEDAEDKPWGDRVATVTDPDGYRWMLASFKKLAPFS